MTNPATQTNIVSDPPAPTGEVGSVYILELVDPTDPTRRLAGHAKYYIGWARDLPGRIHNHRKGRGARITQVAVERGFDLVVVAVWHGVDRNFERTLKNRKNAARIVRQFAATGQPVNIA